MWKTLQNAQKFRAQIREENQATTAWPAPASDRLCHRLGGPFSEDEAGESEGLSACSWWPWTLYLLSYREESYSFSPAPSLPHLLFFPLLLVFPPI